MNNLEDARTCLECGAALLSRRQGLSYLLRCSMCDWALVTTYPHPSLLDKVVYSVFVTSLGGDPARSLIFLNRRFTHGIARTRALFSRGESFLCQGYAHQVWKEARELRSESVPFRIESQFPYDLDDPKLAFGYSEEWSPLSSLP